jgi:hypothetical protein
MSAFGKSPVPLERLKLGREAAVAPLRTEHLDSEHLKARDSQELIRRFSNVLTEFSDGRGAACLKIGLYSYILRIRRGGAMSGRQAKIITDSMLRRMLARIRRNASEDRDRVQNHIWLRICRSGNRAARSLSFQFLRQPHGVPISLYQFQ